jgi:decaprenylphospho-beta-D-erythro-pentofuranosid-2-ulose 2-reductase
LGFALTQKIVIVGATSSIATHCGRLWSQGKVVDLHLIGRDRERLERIAADLRARAATGSTVQIVIADFLDAAAIQNSVAQLAAPSKIDIALIAHGSLGDQITCQNDLAKNQAELEVNGVSPALYAEAFAQQMAQTNHGTLCVIGSVAGDRGRRSNYVYGAAKGLVTRYVQGLQHRVAGVKGNQVKVVLIKPGPTDTPMTAQLKAKGMKLAPVEDVAAGIVAAVAAGKPVAYVPGKWWLIMMVIRHLPSVIFNKMNI